MTEEIVYFELNNWFCGRDFPNDKTFGNWIAKDQFSDNIWCKENKLCVLKGSIDMSWNWCIAAPRSWVMANCPQLLSDGEFTYKVIQGNGTVKECTKKYSDFLRYPNFDGDVYGCWDWPFPKYCEYNFGVTYYSEDSYFDEEDEENEDI